jgi:hypothetical protein
LDGFIVIIFSDFGFKQELIDKMIRRVTFKQRLLGNLAQRIPYGFIDYMKQEHAYALLKHYTGQDFGYDIAAWEEWFNKTEKPFPNLNKPMKPIIRNYKIPYIFNKEFDLPSFERVNNIAFCGENPQILLYTNEDDKDNYTAAASYWRSVYSPFGEGNVLLLYLNEENAENYKHPNYAIYSDNLPLAEYLTLTFNQHFDEYKHLSFGTVTPITGRFIQDSDSRNYHRVKCETDSAVIELLWADVRLRQLFILKDLNEGGFGKNGDEHYDVYTNIFLCAKASITLNGNVLSGNIRTRQEGEIFRSSAFMAFSETWIKRE